jgi:tetratricopeptide (TPR) repeat protein
MPQCVRPFGRARGVSEVDPSAELQTRQLLGRSLAALRDAAGYTQEAFAPHTSYSRSTLANVETGRQRVPRAFWLRCDSVLMTGGRLTAEHDRIEAGNRGGQRQEAVHSLDQLRQASVELGGVALPDGVSRMVTELDVDLLVNRSVEDGLSQASQAAVRLDGQSVADLFETVADLARGYADRSRWETFSLARRGRDLACDLANRTRRPPDLVDAYLLASLANGLMASAAFDMARRSAALSLARFSRTFAHLSGNSSAIAWTHGLLATLLNWDNRPEKALQEIGSALASRPNSAGLYRLHSIAARAHALRGDPKSARIALESAARQRPVDGPRLDLLNDEIAGEFRFDKGRAAACAGAAWLQLGNGVEAERSLRSALGTYAAMSARDRPAAPLHGTLVDLAAACLLRADLDATRDALAPVFDLEPEQRISVVTARLLRVHELLQEPQWNGAADAAALCERIEDWMLNAIASPTAAVR